MSKRIVVVGLGYVGFPLAVMLAHSGFRVIGVDTDSRKLMDIEKGLLSHVEEDIKHLLADKRNFKGKLTTQEKLCEADVFIVCVGTPLEKVRRIADLSQLTSAVKSVVPFLRKGNLIIIESTIPPFTCRGLIPLIEKSGLKVGADVFLAHCPERVLPGDILREIKYDRIIGGYDLKSAGLASEIYSSFVTGNIYLTDDVTAEFVKIIENTYRDVNIALANEFAEVSQNLGVNIMDAIKLANTNPRVRMLNPGIGTGGHCVPVDPWFIHQIDPLNTRLIYISRMINENVPFKIASRIRCAVKWISNPKIIVVGVTYKPNAFDIRNSPALKIVDMLKAEGYYIEVYDPIAKGYEYKPLIKLAKDADCLVLLVEHDVVRKELERDEKLIREVMRHPIILRFYEGSK